MNGIRVEVVVALPRHQHVQQVTLPEGACVADALRAAQLTAADGALAVDPVDVGIWGRRVGPDEIVRDGDRVEIYRPLTADPKEARRRRAREAGAPKA